MPRTISKLALTNCLDKQFNHPLLVVLCLPIFTSCVPPSLLLTFISYQHYYGYIRPCGWFLEKGLLHLTGAPLDDSTSVPVVRPGLTADDFT